MKNTDTQKTPYVPTIMIVDDNPENLNVLSGALKESEYRVKSAPSGKLALQAAFIEAPDLILLDIMMPEMDGYEVCRHLKENDATKDTPVIFITALDKEYDEEKGLAAGAVDYITKPIRIPIVIARVNTHMQLKLYRDRLEILVKERTVDLRNANRNLVKQISKKKQARATLNESEERYRSLVDNLPVGIFRTSATDSGRFIHANKSLASMFGTNSVDELMDKSLTEFYEDPADRLRLITELQKHGTVKCREIRYKTKSGEVIWGSISATYHTQAEGTVDWIEGIIEDVTERKSIEDELLSKNEQLDLLINSIGSVIIGVSVKDRITHWNPFAENVFGIKHADIIGKKFGESGIKWDWEIIYEAISRSVVDEKSIRVDELRFEKSGGKNGILGLNINPLKKRGDLLKGFIILGKDISERKIIEAQLLQSNKLQAIGQLAAGVAHEINSPLQYVGDNLRFLNKSFTSLLSLVDMFEKSLKDTNAGDSSQLIMNKVEEFKKNIKLPFLFEQMPEALEQSLDGVNRVSKIVQSMKAFSHPGTGTKTPEDINKSIMNTVTVSRNEWKYDCEIDLDLDQTLPDVPCFESELNQVILNLVINAADALRETKDQNMSCSGVIKISTTHDNTYVTIKIEDNGPGIPEKIKHKIFDPFFTTKEVGKGTGQGLAISHSIIVEKHDGLLYFESTQGKGTTFFIKLPIDRDEE